MPDRDDHRFAFAVEVAQRLGARSREAFLAGAMKVERKAGLDLVTDVDHANERLFRDEVAQRFPRDPVLGEEFGGALAEEVWVIDPIDGTHNFARGAPWWCISIAFLRDARPVIGVVHDPLHDETFAAMSGRGATLNGAPLAAWPVSTISGATIAFGLGPGRASEETLAILAALSVRGATLRGQGAGALSLCHVAAGRLDGFFEREIHLWDVAAAMLVLAESGVHMDFAMDGADATAAAPVSAFAPGLREALLAEADQAPAFAAFAPGTWPGAAAIARTAGTGG